MGKAEKPFPAGVQAYPIAEEQSPPPLSRSTGQCLLRRLENNFPTLALALCWLEENPRMAGGEQLTLGWLCRADRESSNRPQSNTIFLEQKDQPGEELFPAAWQQQAEPSQVYREKIINLAKQVGAGACRSNKEMNNAAQKQHRTPGSNAKAAKSERNTDLRRSRAVTAAGLFT